jgi:DsbC/DsbD-like thiol-disulfide interchange protein
MTSILKICIVLLAGLTLIGKASAASSDWQDLGGGKARIFASKDPITNIVDGVIEVKLDKGWKTYWRSPGGSGIPPEFNFDGSNAFSLTHVTFPVPEWIELNGAAFFGYKDHVSFVFSGMAEDFSTSINLDMLIGVCEEICIPATANMSLTSEALNSSDPQVPIRISLAKSKLPIDGDNQSGIVDFQLNGDMIIATLSSMGKSDQSRIVIAIDGIWTSDPIEFSKDEKGAFVAAIKLPPAIVQSGAVMQNWEYSLIQQSGEAHQVINAIESPFTISQN